MSWDADSDDDWDKSDGEDELDRRLGLAKIDDKAPPKFDDEEEDLTLKDKAADEKASHAINKAKGSALAKKKAADAAAKEELELAKKAMELEAEMEANMTPEERRQMEREREEADAAAMADDLFGGVDDRSMSKGPGGAGKAMMSGDKVVMKDLKDHLRHAKKVGECVQVRENADSSLPSRDPVPCGAHPSDFNSFGVYVSCFHAIGPRKNQPLRSISERGH